MGSPLGSRHGIVGSNLDARPRPANAAVEWTDNNKTCTVTIFGRFNIDTVGQIRDFMKQQFSKGPAKLVFNLSDVSYLDSSAIGLLVATRTVASKARCDFRLVGVSSAIRKLLTQVNLEQFFVIE